MQLIREKKQITRIVQNWRANGESVCLVPTMGGIHEGHLRLLARARKNATRTVLSIYVNPTQFAKNEDFDLYPRDLKKDKDVILESGGCDVIYAPENMYGRSHATTIDPGGVAIPMEGTVRPHFFSGVATVVYKLFSQVPANSAIFGEKDFQQLAVIKQMVRDFEIPIKIISHKTIREKDGLALSSRNQYLGSKDRAIAPNLYGQIRWASNAISSGLGVEEALKKARQTLESIGFNKVDYFDLRRASDLRLCKKAEPKTRIFAAVMLGDVRLIDNCELK